MQMGTVEARRQHCTCHRRFLRPCLLYPWTNKNCFYPLGHPIIICQSKGTDISTYSGLVKCKIFPSYGLYHPILPHRSGSNLAFPLCQACIEHEQLKPLNERSDHCVHTKAKRCLVGTWPTLKLQETLHCSYECEVWHFLRKSNKLLFYVKMKQEASGWLEWVGDNKDKRQRHIQNYRAKSMLD